MLFPVGFLQKMPNACQQKASTAFFPLIWEWCFFIKSYKFAGETTISHQGFSHLVKHSELTFCAIASFLPGSYVSTWEWQFSFISYRKISDRSWCFLINEFPCQNQTKSSSRFLPYHIPRATPFSMYSTWPRFVKIPYLSYLCVKFQASNCIFTLHFDQFPSSPNYVRGVRASLSPSVSCGS